MPERLTRETLGAWLLKAHPATPGFESLAQDGFTGVRTRCVRASYRTELVEAGQPVLLWVSGRDPRHPAGLHAQGRTRGEAGTEDGEPVLPVALAPLEVPVPRAELLAHPLLRDLEVLRMPAGSNPSYLTGEQYAALRADWPQVD